PTRPARSPPGSARRPRRPRNAWQRLRTSSRPSTPLNLVFGVRHRRAPLFDRAAARAAAGAGRIIAVGSERGWADRERDVLRENGFQTVRLGERILRTETAAIAAVTVTLRELGIV
ncbi:MAG: RsmE family RNA methyltransferase, partial [Spirochaetia bacterium]